MSTPISERKPLALIVSEYGDFDGRDPVPAGYTHLPASPNGQLDCGLRQSAATLRVPHTRYLARMYRLGYGGRWEKTYSGIVVPEDRAEEVAALADLYVGGHVKLEPFTFQENQRVVNLRPKRLKIEWIDHPQAPGDENPLTESKPVNSPLGQ